MTTAPLLGKSRPCILDQATILKTDCQPKRSAAGFRVPFDTPARAVTDLVPVQSFAETNPVSYRHWQCRFVAIATNRRQIDVFAPNKTFVSQCVACGQIERYGIAIPAGYDKNVVAISLPKIPPGFDRARLCCLAPGDEINPAMLGVDPKPGF